MSRVCWGWPGTLGTQGPEGVWASGVLVAPRECRGIGDDSRGVR